MSYELGVWHSARAISNQEAADLYDKLREQKWLPKEQHVDVYAFYNELTSRCPEVETVPERELDACPWSCAHERSGLHVIMAMLEDKRAEVLPLILELAEKYGLVCFDPQASKIYLPSHLQPTASAERLGTLNIDWINPGQQLPRYHVNFDDHASSGGQMKTGEIFGEKNLVDFLTADIGLNPAIVDSALKELSTKGDASIRDIALSEVKLMVLGLR